LGEEFILIRPQLAGFRAELQAQLKSALAGLKADVAVRANVAAVRAAAVPGKTAAAQALKETSAVTTRLGDVSTATDRVTAAQERLAVAAKNTKTQINGIVLPAGVRDAVSVSNSAAEAQRKLAQAAKVTKGELAGIVLPPGIRSVTVETEQAAVAQTKLAQSAKAAKAELASLSAQQRINAAVAAAPSAERVLPSGVILPTTLREGTVANKEAARAQKELAAAESVTARTTKATTEELEKISPTSGRAAAATRAFSQDVQKAETAAGRYTRGLFAATAASSGFFRAVSFASGAFLVGALAGGAIASAVQEFRDMTVVAAQTQAVLRATGGAANITAKGIDALAQSQLALTGTDDELVKQAANVLLTFRQIRNEGSGMNAIFTRSVKAVQDISAVFGTDLRGSAVQLGKALQDPIRGVTALRRSGITLSQSQRDLIKNLVESGRILTAQKVILGEVEHQVGGTAEAFGRTLPGRLQIFREEAKNSMGEFVKRITESEQVTKVFSQSLGGIRDGFKTVAVVLAPLKVLFLALGAAVSGLARIGALKPLVEALTAAAIAFGALRLSLASASAAQAIYTRATTVAAAATVAEGAAAQATATRISLGTAALGALKGPLGITIGITAAIFGLQALRKEADRLPGSFSNAKRALDDLSASINALTGARGDRAAAAENVSIARINQAAAQRRVDAAQRALGASNAAPGSLAKLGLEQQVTKARIDLAKATRELTAAQGKYADTNADVAASERGVAAPLSQSTKAWLDHFSALRKVASIKLTPAQQLSGPGQLGAAFAGARAAAPAKAVEEARREFEKLADTGNKTDKVFARVLLRILQLNRLPTTKELNVALRLAPEGQSTRQILAALGFGGLDVQRPVSPQLQENFNLQEQVRAAQALIAHEQKRLRTLKETAAKQQDILDTIKATVRADREAVTNSQDALTSARQSLDDARRSYRDAVQTLRDTIIQSNQAIAEAIKNARNSVTQSVRDAKSNLASLGQTIADILNQVNAAGGGGSSGKLGAKFQQLRQQILAGGGGAETQRIAQQLAFRAQGEKPPTADVTQKINDLTDKLARGLITPAQFERQLRGILKGVTPAEVAKVLGSAVGNQFKDALAAIFGQGRAVAAGPRRPGGADPLDIVHPLNAVAAGAKAIAAARTQAAKDIGQATRSVAAAARGITTAQRQVVRAERSLADAIRKLRDDQVRETHANTVAQRANTKATNQLAKVLGAKAKFEQTQNKAKPKGKSAETATAVIDQGAVAP
jgi:uncharacterized coiled-coil protein SlyX